MRLEPKNSRQTGDDDSDCNNKWRKFGLIATEDAEGVSNNDSNIESPLGDFTILPSRIGINTNIPDSSTVIEVLDGLLLPAPRMCYGWADEPS